MLILAFMCACVCACACVSAYDNKKAQTAKVSAIC